MPRLLHVLLVLSFVLGLGQVKATDVPEECAERPFSDPGPDSMSLIELGRDLFYDPILSGNRTVACATCHHPAFGTSDGVSLSLGDGATGLGPGRRADPRNLPEKRIPRNAPALFNLTYAEFDVMFHDGRVERLDNGMIRTPLGDVPDEGPLSVLAAQAGFPVISPDEMAGHYSENPISEAVRKGLIKGSGGARQLIADRVAAIPGYRSRLHALFGPDTDFDYQHLARPMAAFIAHEWRADNSPFDRYICQGEPLDSQAAEGMALFYGSAGCSGCHAGRFQTDHGFHAIAMPQIGPGKAERFEPHARDTGRMRVTGDPDDAYRFKTPSLRNVTLTAPYGHAGAYLDLRSVIRHHLDPEASWAAFNTSKLLLPVLTGASDFTILASPDDQRAILAAREQVLPDLSDAEIEKIIAFLHALTDRTGIDGRLGVPRSVPSGLPVPNP